MPALPHGITISDEERTYLNSLIKTRTIQAQVVLIEPACCYGNPKPKRIKPLQMGWGSA